MVTQNDTTSYSYGKKGLVKVTLMECVNNNATDRVDLGICDYIDKDQYKTDNADNISVSKSVVKSVISYNTTTIKSGGDSQMFIGKFFDNKGNEVANIIPKWDIICDFKDALKLDVSGNQISIEIDNDYYVDEEFKLVLSDNDGNYSSSLIIQIGSLL